MEIEEDFETFRSYQDLRRFIDDHLIETRFYRNDYVDIVARLYCNHLIGLGWGFGEQLPHVSDDVFWEFFKEAETDLKHEDILKHFLECHHRLHLFSPDPIDREIEEFIKFANDRMTDQECIDVLDNHNSIIYDNYIER